MIILTPYYKEHSKCMIVFLKLWEGAVTQWGLRSFIHDNVFDSTNTNELSKTPENLML